MEGIEVCGDGREQQRGCEACRDTNLFAWYVLDSEVVFFNIWFQANRMFLKIIAHLYGCVFRAGR